MTLEERFWEKVVKSEGCWSWTGATGDFGHGVIGSGGQRGRLLKAHRVSWEIHFGPIPPGLCVLHHCDNPPCCNPDCLFLGTLADNNEDKMAKGRGDFLYGATNPSARLTQAQVDEIRSRYPAETQVQLAQVFGVHYTTIGRIVHRRGWAHS
jgi:hypothetical protein